MTLLEYGHSLGLKLDGFHFGCHVGWTTDGEAAQKMREHGARVTGYAHKGWKGGWEVSFPRDAEVVDLLARQAQGAVA